MPVPGGVWHWVQEHAVPRMIAQTPIVTSFLTCLSSGEGERGSSGVVEKSDRCSRLPKQRQPPRSVPARRREARSARPHPKGARHL
jgi:hypothetical protein